MAPLFWPLIRGATRNKTQAYISLTTSIWHPTKKEARFVEVKGPGDSLSETQKVWIDVLLSAGVPVEVCKVKAKLPGAGGTSDGEEGGKAKSRGIKGRSASVAGSEVGTKGVKRKSSLNVGAGDSAKKGKGPERKGSGSVSGNGWKRVKNYDLGDEEGSKGNKDEEEEEEGEFAYESGEEGKPEGRWEKR
jgi:Fanconi-associated nuclease 1